MFVSSLLYGHPFRTAALYLYASVTLFNLNVCHVMSSAFISCPLIVFLNSTSKRHAVAFS